MRFLLDAQLPPALARTLAAAGHDAIHARTLPAGNQTPDPDLAALADAEDRVMVTKDNDFVVSHLLAGSPRRSLLVATGNIRTADLISLFLLSRPLIEQGFLAGVFLEIDRTRVAVRR